MNLIKVGGLEAGLTIPTDKEGHPVLLVVVKATYVVRPDGRCVLERPQIPPTKADVHLGEPGLSSVVYETDYATKKVRTDVLVNGHAYAPGGRPTEVVDATVSVGPLTKTIRVFGDRIWKPGLVVGHHPSTPIPFTKMPLVYERAFGGVDRTVEDKPRYEMRNPVGRGFHGLKAAVEGTLLPNLENPAALIGNPYDTPEPVGFGPVGRAWTARSRFAGTYDQKWQDEVFPFLPKDFDDRYFQAAPPDQIVGPLKGNEKVSLNHLTPDGRLEFTLPAPDIGVRVLRRAAAEELQTTLDTVLLEPDHRRCVLVWRASERLQGKPSRILEVHAGAWSPARRKAESTGRKFLDWTPRR